MKPGLSQQVVICATQETVFRFFTDSARFAAWWGEGSHVEPKVGGRVVIRYPNGETASGQFVDLSSPRRVAFTFGYDAPGKPIPPGGSLVTVELESVADGTRVTLTHSGVDEPILLLHAGGWRYHLAQFSLAATAEQHRDAAAIVDRYFAAWSETDAAARRSLLETSVTDDVLFQDRYGYVRGIDALTAHLEGVQRFMPGARLSRDGEPALSHGALLVRWSAGASGGRGTNAIDLSPDGRIRRVVGFWGS